MTTKRAPLQQASPVWVDFLIRAQRVRLGFSAAENLAIPADPDWRAFRHAVKFHGLLLGTIAALSSSGILEQMPPDVLDGFRDEGHRLSTFQISQAVELGHVAKLLASARIPALALKGPVLTQQLFGDVVSRESADLDLLVPYDSVFAASDALEAAGYTWAETGPRPVRDADLTANHAFTLKSRSDQFLVDLHWHLAEDVALEFVPQLSTLFDDPETVDLFGKPVSTVRREQQLPLLAFHAVKHAWYLLKWFVDIAAFAKVSGLDWDSVLRHISGSKSKGVARVSHLGLLVADQLFDCALPPEVRQRIAKDRRAVALAPIVINDLRASHTYDMSEQHRILLGLNESVWSRLKTAGTDVVRRAAQLPQGH